MYTREQFQEAKTHLIARYGPRQTTRDRERLQAVARLYAASGWKATAIAAMEHRAHGHVSQMKIYGRYLCWLDTQAEADTSISEWQFRRCWGETKGLHGEDVRFAAVAQLYAMHREHPGTVPDGLTRLLTKGGGKTQTIIATLAALEPILKDLDTLARGHRIDFSQYAVTLAVAKMRKVLDGLVVTHQAAPSTPTEHDEDKANVHPTQVQHASRNAGIDSPLCHDDALGCRTGV